MKIRAWQMNKIKKMVKDYDSSKEYFEKCLKEIAEQSNKPYGKILVAVCSNCEIEFERSYSQDVTYRRKVIGRKTKRFCSQQCANVYSMEKNRETYNKETKLYEVKKQSSNYYKNI
jgi:hypothetical protein